jgi:hypothetical protein
MRHFPVPDVRNDSADAVAKSRADLSRRHAQIDSLHAVTVRTRKRVRETRELLEQADVMLEEFNAAWRRSS